MPAAVWLSFWSRTSCILRLILPIDFVSCMKEKCRRNYRPRAFSATAVCLRQRRSSRHFSAHSYEAALLLRPQLDEYIQTESADRIIGNQNVLFQWCSAKSHEHDRLRSGLCILSAELIFAPISFAPIVACLAGRRLLRRLHLADYGGTDNARHVLKCAAN